MKTGIYVVVVLAVMASVAAEVAQFRKCPGTSQDMCSVSALRVDPCPKKKQNACMLKKGADYNVSFDFTPNFSASKLTSAVYWPGPTKEVQFADVGDLDACLYSACPTAPGSQNTFQFGLHLAKKLPKGTFVLRWKIWNPENQEQLCCMETSVYLK